MPRQSKSFESREIILQGAKWSPCKYCKHPIILGSKVCTHCNRNQNFFFEYLQTLSVAVAVGVLILSIWQAWSATNQATKAEVAMVAARKAASEAEKALKLAKEIRLSLINLEVGSANDSVDIDNTRLRETVQRAEALDRLKQNEKDNINYILLDAELDYEVSSIKAIQTRIKKYNERLSALRALTETNGN